MNNNIEYPIAMLGACRAGLVIVPINSRLHPKEVAFIVSDADIKLLVYGQSQSYEAQYLATVFPSLYLVGTGHCGVGRRFPSFLDESQLAVEDVHPDDPAWLFYTSGTTGRPKGAVLSHRNLERMTVGCLADIYSFRPSDIVLHLMPLSHGSGLYLLPSLARGSTNVIPTSGRFDATEVLATIEREHVTVIPSLPPTAIVRLLSVPKRFATRSLRCVIYGGGPIHVEHLRAAVERFGKVFVQIYGQGEAPMTITYLPAEDHDPGDACVLSSAGWPRTDIEIRIVDDDGREVAPGGVGEVIVRGDVVMRGYWRDEEATALTLRDGWLHTGDLGRCDESGRLYLCDRKNDTIISGGINVYPREVEDILVQHPDVAEAAVLGVEDEEWGEKIVAVVVCNTASVPTADELKEHCRAHIARFKTPREIVFANELPKNAYGKVLRRELRKRFVEERLG